MQRIFVRILATCLVLFSWGEAGPARAEAQAFVPFAEFLGSVELATFDTFAPREDAAVETPADFQAMRRHVLSLYQGVDVEHSFLLDGQTFDCVPVEQQPAVRALGPGAVLPEPPAPFAAASVEPGPARQLVSPLSLGLADAFGHAVHCDAGTIPMRRVTLEEMSRFGSLEAFFRKTPFPVGSPEDLAAKATYVHKYAHAYQNVKNYGGNSLLNVWSPAINTAKNQIFSLSQHWYVGGSGAKLQTVEGGWQAYPAKYSTTKSVLFIYWTADAYNHTGCYNLDCTAFVQTNSNWHLGGTWTNYSSKGGTQWEFQMQWYLYQGNWWLFIQGDAVGYYPGSKFGSGQLSKWATEVDFGGETVGTTSWPPMGSGGFAKTGFKQAAYQRQIFYIKTPGTSKWTSLTAVQNSPKCYTLKLTPSSSGGDWGTYFYFGGPGGTGC